MGLTMLNNDQLKALSFIKTWYKSRSLVMVLDGAGGTGKTFLVDTVLKELNVNSLILAPTHEALKQLKDKVVGDYVYKTCHSALGMSPVNTTKGLVFEQRGDLTKRFEEVQLIIIDECSQLSKDFVEHFLDIGIKTLYIGHKSQLPEVDPKRKQFNKCVSDVFTRGLPTITLTQPMRNIGNLWDFNNKLEEAIYLNSYVVPDTFDIRKKELTALLNCERGKNNLQTGKTKLVCWSNTAVDKYNQEIRVILYGLEAKLNKFLPKDKLILIKPMTVIQNLDYYDSSLLLLKINRENIELFTNSKAEVLYVKQVVINLNHKLHIPCYELIVLCEGETIALYVPVEEKALETIETFYKHIAWNKSGKDKDKAYKEMYFILSCFAVVKHFYAATSYRLQGSTVDNIVVINSDIAKCPNRVEQAKHRYVACSRAKNNLYYYRGI